MSIEVSVIMISHNKYPQNLLTLYSFQNQTYDPEKFEVIFVDDSSTDQTTTLSNLETPFTFKYVRSKHNVGRSRAKNIGIQHASGKILIFLDVEMLVDPDFIEHHIHLHQTKENLVISCTNQQKIVYTVLDPKFNEKQIKRFYSMIKTKPKLLRKWKLSLSNHTKNMHLLLRYIKRIKRPVPLLGKQGIQSLFFHQLAYPDPTFPTIIRDYGPWLNGFHLPWIFCITRAVSFRKTLLDQVGYFNEEFAGWGSEDNELGYRLYKAGATFYDAPQIATYHQEHPYILTERKKEMIGNIVKFQQIHPDIDVAVISLPFIGKGSFVKASQVLHEYRTLSNQYPEQNKTFRDTLKKGLQAALKMFLENRSLVNLSEFVGLKDDEKWKETVLSELKILRSDDRFKRLVKVFDELFGDIEN
ncbi:glycosyltransferase family 2 protein [Tepidibacillus infernus]|uniref:glycosyltransferase family 2 protein n=1 Tax=Tepidibacillus infernus TaxID=1806172 RepID=UPI003B7149D3